MVLGDVAMRIPVQTTSGEITVSSVELRKEPDFTLVGAEAFVVEI